MAKKLVIVESPAKAQTLGRFLGKDYVVRPSVGHIRDLPENRLGVDIEADFRPHYVIPEKKKEIVKKLRAEAREASEIYLATDPDREGEAISWHLIEALNLKDGKPVHRVEFHEITKEAVTAAFANPRTINENLVNAQQARRILDRLVGYTLSPLLRRKITKKGLSAGRVQSVAVRLVVEREREIQAFQPTEYWTLEADLSKAEEKRRGRRQVFTATLHQIRGEKADLRTEEQARAVVADLEGATFVVGEVRQREVQRHPAPPFTTSTLQQEAARKLGFTPKRTMAVAQQLYEGLPVGDEGTVGLITYMRTDSVHLAASAVEQIRAYIREHYDSAYLPAQPRVYKTRSKNAQEAHEAIRPTSIFRHPEAIKPYLTQDQYRLYKLIWQRTLACQMASAVLDTTSVDILAGRDGQWPYLFRATGSVVKFPGFTVVYTEGRDDEPTDDEEAGRALPPLATGDQLTLVALRPEQHFTQPPPRYTEATLVKALEEHGIGRPSTYAPILATIQERGYVERVDRRLVPTPLGFLVTDLLVEHFPDIFDVGFTAEMEEKLDEIARGAQGPGDKPLWVQVLWDFYRPFIRDVERADQQIARITLAQEPTGETCERCGRPMVVKYGRFGKFIACSGYPECRNSKSLQVKIGVRCPQCGGDLVEKKTRRKRTFYSCGRYPDCTFAVWTRPQPCPTCGTALLPAGKDEATCPVCSGVAAPAGASS